jgi:large subunit ribosomal protein L4
LRSALSAKVRDGELRVVRAFELADPKTKNMAAILGMLEAKNTVLLVESGENTNLTRASRNLPGVKLVPTKDVNVYDLLKYQEVLLSESAARKLSEALA